MRTLTFDVVVTPNHTVTLTLPEDVRPGRKQMVVVIEEQADREQPTTSALDDFPVDHLGAWPEDLSLRREDLYSDDGR